MFDHIGLRTANLTAAVSFYERLLEPLGLVRCFLDETTAGFGRTGSPAFWLHGSGASAGSGVHIAFQAADRRAVERFHAAGLLAGGRDNGPPGLRADYSPTYYAAFLIDPDGNNVEAVCHAAMASIDAEAPR